MTDRVEDTLKHMLVDRMILKMDPEAIEDEGSLMDDYGVDSVCLLEMVVGIEEAFGIEVADEDFSLETFRSVSSIADYVRSKQGATGPDVAGDAE